MRDQPWIGCVILKFTQADAAMKLKRFTVEDIPALVSVEATGADVCQAEAITEPPCELSAGAPRLIGERVHRFYFLDAHHVDYLQVDGNYVTIHVGEDKYLTRTTLKRLSDVLAPHDFLRIDRPLLVNLRRVDYVERLESGQFAFCLRRGQRLVSSRERSAAIVRLLRGGVL